MPVKKKKGFKKKTVPSIILRTEPRIYAKKPSDYMFLFFGPPGTGKTTLANNFGKVFFMSTDRGTRFLPAIAEEIDTWEDFDRELGKLERYKKKHGSLPYDYFCLDHVTDWSEMVKLFVCDTNGVEDLGDIGHGRGWSKYKGILSESVRRIKSLGIGVIFICHEKILQIKAKGGLDTNITMPMMQKNAYELLIPIVDIVGYLSMQVFKKNGKQVELVGLQTKPSKHIQTKDRTNRVIPGNSDIQIISKDTAKNFLDTFTKGETSAKEKRNKEEKRKVKKTKKKRIRR